MSRAMLTCLPDTPIERAALAMTERHSRSIVVVDEHGRATGVLTGIDLLSVYERDGDGTVSEHMTSPVVTCDAEATLSAAAELMISREVHRLVVIEPLEHGDAPVGVLSTADIVGEMAHECSAWRVAA
jgi:CBS domain-containing protein